LIDQYPYFTRTIPPDSAVSEAAVMFLQNQGFTKIGCVYINDSYGQAFKDGVQRAAIKFGVSAYSSPLMSDFSTNPVQNILDESDNLVNAWVGVLFTSHLDQL
jgi:ABC-type branched-subunit amino acid transport system substrate-binding protein